MNDDTVNMDVRRFLKAVGVSSQREIDRFVGEAMAAGRLTGSETLHARITLSIDGTDFTHEVEGDIRLE
jgi:hypothetical protein